MTTGISNMNRLLPSTIRRANEHLSKEIPDERKKLTTVTGIQRNVGFGSIYFCYLTQQCQNITSGGRSVGIVRSRTKATELVN
jgi:hypothetical protein